jgi:hypothetical protein
VPDVVGHLAIPKQMNRGDARKREFKSDDHDHVRGGHHESPERGVVPIEAPRGCHQGAHEDDGPERVGDQGPPTSDHSRRMPHDCDEAATPGSGSSAIVDERDDFTAGRLTEDRNP